MLADSGISLFLAHLPVQSLHHVDLKALKLCFLEKLQGRTHSLKGLSPHSPSPFLFQTREWGLLESKCLLFTYTLYITFQTLNTQGDSTKRWVLDKQESLLRIHSYSSSQSHAWLYINSMNEPFPKKGTKGLPFLLHVRTQKMSFINQKACLMPKLQFLSLCFLIYWIRIKTSCYF